MSSKGWGPTDRETAIRRAKGRARYHSMRRLKMQLRQIETLRLLAEFGLTHGVQKKIAFVLHVHPCTITRDLQRACPWRRD